MIFYLTNQSLISNPASPSERAVLKVVIQFIFPLSSSDLEKIKIEYCPPPSREWLVAKRWLRTDLSIFFTQYGTIKLPVFSRFQVGNIKLSRLLEVSWCGPTKIDSPLSSSLPFCSSPPSYSNCFLYPTSSVACMLEDNAASHFLPAVRIGSCVDSSSLHASTELPEYSISS